MNRWALGAKSRRLFLQAGLPWAAAILVGLVSVLYAEWSKEASDVFLGWIAGRAWLAFVITIEELARDFESRTNGIMITAVVFSGLTSLALAGNYLYFGQINVPTNLGAAFIAPVVLSAALAGLFGAAFNLALLRWRTWMPDWLIAVRARWPLLYALMIGIVIAALGFGTHGETWGSGYDQARHLLMGTAPISATYAVTKWAAMVATYMVGIPGGLFSPSLSIGAGLAQWVHAAFAWAPMAEVIALCMTGYLAAVTQSPITSFVIVLEMTNGNSMVIPMMATALVASRISAVFTPPLYEALAKNNYFQVATLPPGGFLQTKPVPPPGA